MEAATSSSVTIWAVCSKCRGSASSGNTPAVCRTCYVHPGVIECYLDRSLLAIWDQARRSIGTSIKGLHEEEAILLTVLRRHLSAA